MSAALAQRISEINNWFTIQTGSETIHREEITFSPFIRTLKRTLQNQKIQISSY